MIINTSQITGLMDEIAGAVGMRVDVYLIGGGALMFNDLKVQTKDVDIVVRTREEFGTLEGALPRLGFWQTRPRMGSERMNLSGTYEREEDGFCIDLFETRVCDELSLSESMASRAKLEADNGKVGLHVCALEDILIFKSITERPGDEGDTVEIITRGVDWNLILEEVRVQADAYEGEWITWLSERLHHLSERYDVSVPVLRELSKMSDRFMEAWADRMEAEIEAARKLGANPKGD